MKDNFQVSANFELEWLASSQPQSASDVKEEPAAFSCDGGEYDHVSTIQNDVTDVQSKPYVCQICNKGFIRSEDYQGHCLEHDGIEKPHICPTCGRGFSRKGNLRSHMRTHTGVRPYLCEFCGKGFSRKEDLLAHKLTHDLYFCEVCNIYHSRAESHEGCVLSGVVEMYTCELCRKSFARKSNLKAHELTHMGEKPYVCTICSKGFARKEDLEGHTFSHSGVSMYVCEICSKGFNRKSNFELHVRGHKKQVYSCELCGRTFVTKSSFENHLETHSSNSFSCSFCNKTYSKKYALRAHCRTHHSEEITVMEDHGINSVTFLIPESEPVVCDLGPLVVTAHNLC